MYRLQITTHILHEHLVFIPTLHYSTCYLQYCPLYRLSHLHYCTIYLSHRWPLPVTLNALLLLFYSWRMRIFFKKEKKEPDDASPKRRGPQRKAHHANEIRLLSHQPPTVLGFNVLDDFFAFPAALDTSRAIPTNDPDQRSRPGQTARLVYDKYATQACMQLVGATSSRHTRNALCFITISIFAVRQDTST